MDSYIEKRYGWRFWCSLGTALSLACFCAWLLYEDFTARTGVGEGPPIATMERAENLVQRKPSTSFQWTPIDPKSQVYSKDTIRVGEKGFAKLKFNDGKELELEENSYVVLHDQAGYGADFIDVVAGSAIVREKGKEEQIESSDGSVHQKKSLSAQLISPSPRTVYFTKTKLRREIEFTWKGELPESGAVLEIASQKSFPAAQSQTVALTRDMTHATTSFTAGDYYWRIRTEKETLSRVSSFTVQNAFTGIPKTPRELVISLSGSPLVSFEWSLPSNAIGERNDDPGVHRIQISPSKNFEPIEKELTVSLKSGVTTTGDLPAGNFFWRVSSRFDDISLESSPLAFTHEFREQRPLTLVDTSKEFVAPTSDPFATAVETEFKWRPDPAAEKYVFELRGSDGKVIQTFETTSSEIAVKAPPAGQYQWHVKAFAGDKKVAESDWSDLKVIGNKKITLLSPKHDEEIPSQRLAQFKFKWKPSEDALGSKYRIKVARDSNLMLGALEKEIDAVEITGSSLNLTNDKYYWRVDWLDENGVTVGTSPVETFRLGRRLELPAPRPIELAKGPLWDVMNEKKLPFIEWEKVPGASKYEIVVKQNDKLVSRELTAQNRFDLKTKIDGDFNWTVRAFDETGTPGEFMEPKTLKVLYPRLPAPKGLRSQTAKPKALKR